MRYYKTNAISNVYKNSFRPAIIKTIGEMSLQKINFDMTGSMYHHESYRIFQG